MQSLNMDSLYRLIVQHTSDHVTVMDLDGTILYAAPTRADFFGYTDEELMQRSAFEFIHPEDIPYIQAQFQKAIDTQSDCQCQFRFKHRDGHWKFVEVQAIPTVNDDGAIAALIFVTQDITHAKATEEALRQSEVKYRSVINNIREVVFQTDEQGVCTLLNPAWTKITGFPVEHTIGRNLLDFVHPHDHQRHIDEFVNLLRGGKGYSRYEIRYLTESGCNCWFEITAGLLCREDGTVRGTSGSMRDITDNKLAQHELSKSEQKYKSLFEYNPDAVFSLSLHGNFLSANEAVERIIGYSTDEMLQLSFFTLAVNDEVEKFLEHFGRALSGEPQDFETAILHKDGNRIEIRLTTMPIIINKEVVGIYGIAKDITRRKRVEEALIAAKEEAERANEAKSSFLSSMSHELRTPMNAILGFAQILKYDPVEPLTAFQQESVDHIMKAGSHLLNLINDILDLSRIEAGSMFVSLEAVSVQNVTEEAVSLLIPLAEQRGIVIDNRVSQSQQLFVYADYTRLKQALVNLISNAVKYNKMNGSVTVRHETTEHGHVRIYVEDTGAGLERHQLTAIFEPFNRLGAERKNIEGTGIGLTITKRILDIMGGSVGVTSTVGVGSTFYLQLPMASDQLFADTVQQYAETLDEQPLSRYTILYIEDNPSNLALVDQILSRRNDISLMTAQQVGLGIELARGHHPDLILMDINLPDVDGFKALEILQKDAETRSIPVIALSANAMPRDIEAGLQAGFVRYLTKPILIPQFLEAVYSVLGTAEPQ